MTHGAEYLQARASKRAGETELSWVVWHCRPAQPSLRSSTTPFYSAARSAAQALQILLRSAVTFCSALSCREDWQHGSGVIDLTAFSLVNLRLGHSLSSSQLLQVQKPASCSLTIMPVSKISPCLWFNGQAEEAAQFYTSLFEDGAILNTSRYEEGHPFPDHFPVSHLSCDLGTSATSCESSYMIGTLQPRSEPKQLLALGQQDNAAGHLWAALPQIHSQAP